MKTITDLMRVMMMKYKFSLWSQSNDDVAENENINSKNEDLDEEENVDVEVDIEGELICALKEIKKLRNKNLSLKEKLQEDEEEDPKLKEKVSHSIEYSRKTIIYLKIQLEEEKIIKEVIRRNLNEKEENFQKIDLEVVFLRKEPEKTTD